MRVRIITRFKNEEFFQAREEAGLTQHALGELCGLGKNGGARINDYENFRAYPRDGKNLKHVNLIMNLEQILKRPYEMLFPEEYRNAVDRRLGRPIHGVMEVKELPEWQERNLMLPSPEESYDKVELREAVRQSLSSLRKRERTVLSLRLGLEGGREHELSEIGQLLRVTSERVRQIEQRAIRVILRSKSDSAKTIRSFLGRR